MNIKSFENIYFIGIGGIGMSALAKYFHAQQKQVSGYDKTASAITTSLESLGIKIAFNDTFESIEATYLNPEKTLVITTPAIPKTNTLLNAFKTRGFKIIKRAEALGLITNSTKCLAVGGTHGKTTTTSILGHLMFECDQKVTAFFGGISENYKSNLIQNGSAITVVEADEFDRSFLSLKPHLACITSIDADHLDIYGTKANLIDAFQAFSNLLPSSDKLFVHASVPIPGITYAVEAPADFTAINVTIRNGGYVFDLKTPEQTIENLKFFMPGKHNLSNAVAALAMALACGCTPLKLIAALKSYKGVERRFSYRIKSESFVFIDDYAHHPKEIDAVWEAVSEMYPQKKVTAVFQPHLYSRTLDFAEDFAVSLSKFDAVLLLDIYPAREAPISGVTSDLLLQKITTETKQLVQKSALVTAITSIGNPVLITMGAGDIGQEVEPLTKNLMYA